MNENIFINGLNYFLISSIASIILALIFIFIVKMLIRGIDLKHQDKIATNQYIYQTLKTIVWLVVFMIIIRQIKPLSSIGDTILGATSIIAIAVGIAAQATFGNYIAGFFLAVHRPFKVGDIIYIKERGISGTVQEITFRHTILQTQEHTKIIIPNTFMNTAVVEDMSNGDYSRIIELNITGDSNLNTLQKIIDKLLAKEELVKKDKQAKITIKQINKDGYLVHFPIYTNSLQDFVDVRDKLLPDLYKELKKNKIKMY